MPVAIHAGHAYRKRERIIRLTHCFEYGFNAMWPWWHAQPLSRNWHQTVFCTVGQQWMQAQLDWVRAVINLGDLSDDEMAALPEEAIDPGTGRPLRWLVNVPPSTTKSSCFTEALPCWWWWLHPEWRSLFGAHSLRRLAQEHQANRTKLLRSPQYAEVAAECGWSIRKSNTEEARTDRGGWMLLVSAEGKGSGIGLHHHSILFDDMMTLKGMPSDANRRKCKDTITEDLKDRYIYKRAAASMMVMQRLGIGDPSDMLLQTEEWKNASRLILPRTYDPERYDLPEDDPGYIPEQLDMGEPVEVIKRAFYGDKKWQGYLARLDTAGFWLEKVNGRDHLMWRDKRTVPGKHLNLRRYSADDEKADRDKGNGEWDAIQQQWPKPIGGGTIQRTWFDAADPDGGWKRLPKGKPDELLFFGDTQKPDQQGVKDPDFTVLTVFARYAEHIYLIETIRERMDQIRLDPVTYLLYQRHKGGGVKGLLEASNAASSCVNKLRPFGIRLEAIKPVGSKLERLEAAAPMVQRGIVHLPHRDAERPEWLSEEQQWPLLRIDLDDERLPPQLRPAAGTAAPDPIEVHPPHVWVPKFRNEVCNISRGRRPPHDDQADALSGGLGAMSQATMPSRMPDLSGLVGRRQSAGKRRYSM